RDFLAEVSLLTDQDTGDDNDNKVTLMTVHAAKGLEFKNVFIVGLEEELFPSSMSLGTMEGIEEERRLFYVAITRAMTNCVITYATSRYRNGQTMSCVASRFLRDIDSANLQCNTSSMAQTVENDFSKIRESFWPTTSERTSPNLTRPASTQSVPSSITPRGAKSEATKATSSNMQKHTVSELTAGMVILHDKFGQGTISSVDDSGADAKIKVNFDSLGVKTLMLNFAKFSILS
ncbi:MAG: ATP-binding domain-containing protein, partial [Muribaculaceae bacterium]|nr:ATP-binding domain-containing protein [Muribaculaceae bacterium]